MHRLLFLVLLPWLAGCENFRRLADDLDFNRDRDTVVINIENHDQTEGILWGILMDWDPKQEEVVSADVSSGALGSIGFLTQRKWDHYVAAFIDRNRNERYDPGEPAWYLADEFGEPTPMKISKVTRKGRVSGRLSTETRVPSSLIEAGRAYRKGRPLEDVIAGESIRVALGEVADLDDPKFSAEVGEEGLWTPSSFPIEAGIGIYFLDEYDPDKIPVLFVYGMAGSPQDWRTFFNRIDRKKYQPWFYYYPTGRRLDELGYALNSGITRMQKHYGFDRLHVVAHSMGGLVSRSFIVKNVLEDGNDYVDTFVSISSPWGGHEAAAMGVKYAPSTVPSWIDMVADSDFQQALYARPLKGRVDHYLIHGGGEEANMIIDGENDGTVSVASMTQKDVRADAVLVRGFKAEHVEILSRRAVTNLVFSILDGKGPTGVTPSTPPVP